ncbi:MAG: biotin transporter BioY [Candidatus Caldarchaeales archaeon]
MIKTRLIVLSSIFAVFTFLGAQIAFYIGPVPITLQTLFIMLSGIVGGYKTGFLSQMIYLGMGLAGLPVFAGFRGGFTTFLGPTTGYLISFPIAAAITGILYDPMSDKRIIKALTACIIAELVIYGLGVPWLIFWLSNFSGIVLSDAISRGITMGALIFLPGDGLKIAVILYLLKRKDFSEIVYRARS